MSGCGRLISSVLIVRPAGFFHMVMGIVGALERVLLVRRDIVVIDDYVAQAQTLQ